MEETLLHNETTDDDIEREIEEQLLALTVEDLEGDLDDYGDVEEDDSGQIPDFEKSVSRYLAFIENNTRKAVHVISESEHFIDDVHKEKADFDGLLQKKLKEKLYDEELTDVMEIRKQVIRDLEDHDEMETRSPTALFSDGDNHVIEPNLIEKLEEMEMNAENELQEMRRRHAEEESMQRLLDEKDRDRIEEMERVAEQLRLDKQIEMDQLKEKNANHQELVEARLEEDFAEEKKQLLLYQERIKESLENELNKEKERLRTLQDELLANRTNKQHSAAAIIQKHFKRFRIQKKYQSRLNQLKTERLKAEKENLYNLQKEEEMKLKVKLEKQLEEEIRMKENRKKQLAEKKQMMEEREKIQKEKQERLQQYEQLKRKVQEQNQSISKTNIFTSQSSNEQTDEYKSTDNNCFRSPTNGTLNAKLSGVCENKLTNNKLIRSDKKQEQELANGDVPRDDRGTVSVQHAVEGHKYLPANLIDSNVNCSCDGAQYDPSEVKVHVLSSFVKSHQENVSSAMLDTKDDQIPTGNSKHFRETIDGHHGTGITQSYNSTPATSPVILDVINDVVDQSRHSEIINNANISSNDSEEAGTSVDRAKSAGILSNFVKDSEVLSTHNDDDNVKFKRNNEQTNDLHLSETTLQLNAETKPEKLLPDMLLHVYKQWLSSLDTLTNVDSPPRRKPFRKTRSIVQNSSSVAVKTFLKSFGQRKTIEEIKVLQLRDVTTNVNIDNLPSTCQHLQYVSCSRVPLSSVHVENTSIQLKYVSLRHCGLLDVSFGPSHISMMNLSHNNMNSLNGFSELSQLLCLDVSNNNIRRLAGIEGCQRLQSLNLDRNEIISTKGLRHLKNISVLSCQDNDITCIDEICHCPLLVTLNLAGNNLAQIPKLKNNTLLCELLLDNNNIPSLHPLSQLFLPCLKYISVKNNGIQGISVLKNLTNLRSLDITSNLVDIETCTNASRQFNGRLKILIDNNSSSSNDVGVRGESTQDSTDIELQDWFLRECDSHTNCLLTRARYMSNQSKNQENLDDEECLNELQKNLDGLEKLLDCCREVLNYHTTLLGKVQQQKQQQPLILQTRLTHEQCDDVIIPYEVLENDKQSAVSTDVFKTSNEVDLSERTSREYDMSNLHERAATKIQALFRGYRVRRAYARFCGEALDYFTRDDDSECGYEEVNLTDFDMDEVLLEWKPAATPQLPLTTIPLPDIRKDNASKPFMAKTRHAWVSPTPTDTPARSATLSSDVGRISSPSDCYSSSDKSTRQRKTEHRNQTNEIVGEWGFHDQRTKELMLKRAKKLGSVKKTSAGSDAQKRYELFKYKSKTTDKRVISPARRTKAPRVSYFQHHSSPRLEFCEQQEATQQMVFRWVCNQAVVHKDSLSGVTTVDSTDSSKQNQQTARSAVEFTLPYLKSSILAGKPPSLIQSEIHNPKPPEMK